jgi:hypothetical protein
MGAVYQAAEILGITVDAIRKRVTRGTIPHERDDDGRVWIILDIDQDTASKVRDTDQPQSDRDALISAKNETIELLKGQLEVQTRANEELIRSLRLLNERLERLALPSPETPEDAAYDVEVEDCTDDAADDVTEQEGEPRRSGWRRWLFGE